MFKQRKPWCTIARLCSVVSLFIPSLLTMWLAGLGLSTHPPSMCSILGSAQPGVPTLQQLGGQVTTEAYIIFCPEMTAVWLSCEAPFALNWSCQSLAARACKHFQLLRVFAAGWLALRLQALIAALSCWHMYTNC